MNNKKYNMTELEKISGIPRRTIHFYSQEELQAIFDTILGEDEQL